MLRMCLPLQVARAYYNMHKRVHISSAHSIFMWLMTLLILECLILSGAQSHCYARTTLLFSLHNKHIGLPHEIESCARDS